MSIDFLNSLKNNILLIMIVLYGGMFFLTIVTGYFKRRKISKQKSELNLISMKNDIEIEKLKKAVIDLEKKFLKIEEDKKE